MTKREKLKKCFGCEQNFYNGNNPYGVQECWSLKTAKTVWRKKVSVNQRPPFTQPAIRVFNCRQEKGYVFLKPGSLTKNGGWKA